MSKRNRYCKCDWNDWYYDEKEDVYRCKMCFGKEKKGSESDDNNL